MICPACRHGMIVVEYRRIELDHCPNCKGVWFDSGELDILLKTTGRESESQFLSELINGPEAATAEARRRCPICRDTMKKLAISQQPPVHIDACPRGNGLWFDGGEVDVLLQELDRKAGVHRNIASYLSEVFQAKKQTA
jgi:Zn-finger nucleic acid-binding protein